MPTGPLILALIIQYTTLIVILYFKENWLDINSHLGVIPWFPIAGPMAIGMFVVIAALVLGLFLAPLGIHNVFKYIIDKIKETTYENNAN